MKRPLFTTLLLCATFALAAQNQSLGFELGFTQPILRENPASGKKKLPNVTTMNGVKIGLVYDATLIKGFGFHWGVNYIYGGNHTKWENELSLSTAQKIRYTHRMHSIEIPIDWQYKFAIAKETWLILYTGPSFQYNFSFDKNTFHKNELLGTNSNSTEKHYKSDTDNDNKEDYRPFNLTWGVGAGFQYQNYYIRGGYDFGILNHYKDPYDNIKDYRRQGRFDQWAIKVGIYFLNF